MEKPITIGVPVYNEEKTISHTLTSIIRSAERTHINYEILVCFNGTTDNGRQIAKNLQQRYYSIKILESEKGKPKAIKSIIEQSDSDYLLFCDGDVVVEENCFDKLLNHFSKLEVMAVTGSPKPWKNESILYQILNARMIYPQSEIAKIPLDGFLEKPFIHGRIYAIRRKVFQEMDNLNKFERSIGDDTYLTYHIIQNYGRRAIVKDYDAIVNYLPVQSLHSWWNKWSRIWSDLERLYQENPNFLELRPFMKTKLDRKYIYTLPMPAPLYFLAERIIHHAGRIYFNLKDNKQKEAWKRLDDTKIIPK